jgi:beta-lactamase regulating signal transducer with metallopeptidase domain
MAPAPAQRATPQESADVRPWAGALLIVWIAGALLTFGWLVMGHARVTRTVRRARPFADARIARAAMNAARELGLTTTVKILRGTDDTPAFTHGVMEPAILLPAAAGTWPEARLRVVLLHELAHVGRHDCLTQLLADVACAIYWFHPAVWSAAQRLRFERERASDDCVLRAGVQPSTYAGHLLDIAVSLQPCSSLSFAAPMAQRSRLEQRLTAILDPHVRHGTPSRRVLAIVAVVACTIILPLAALDPWARPPAAAAPSSSPE